MDEGIKHEVRREVRRIREDRGVSQTEVAARSGIDRATLSQIETGRRAPTVATLGRLADALGCEVADFFPKAEPPLFDPAPQRRGTLRPPGGQFVPPGQFEGAEWRAMPITPEIRRILSGVESGDTTAEEAAPALADAILAMLTAAGGHAAAT